MKFLSSKEAANWCISQGYQLNEKNIPELRREAVVRCAFPTPNHRLVWFSEWLTVTLPAMGDRLLWITQWGVWPSSENWILFERLRLGFSENRKISDAPAILATPDEIKEFASFVQIGLLFGWDVHLKSTKGSLEIFLSHDEWVEFNSTEIGLIEQIKAELKTGNVSILS